MTLGGVYFLTLCGSQGSNSGGQTSWTVPLTAEPSPQPPGQGLLTVTCLLIGGCWPRVRVLRESQDTLVASWLDRGLMQEDKTTSQGSGRARKRRDKESFAPPGEFCHGAAVAPLIAGTHTPFCMCGLHISHIYSCVH